MKSIKPLTARFWGKVDKLESCWIWKGCLVDGYGQFNLGGSERIYAHRFAYLLTFGSIPHWATLDHLCRNRACVNPEHLEPVKFKENLLRGVGLPALNKRKTHCKNGHLFSLENIYIRPSRPNERICRSCRQKGTHHD